MRKNVDQMKTERALRIERIKTLAVYLSGDEFATADIFKLFKGEVTAATIAATLTSMEDQGLLTKRLNRHGLATTYRYRRRNNEILRKRWIDPDIYQLVRDEL